MQDIEIAGDVIRLGQLLELSTLADSGADARELRLAGVYRWRVRAKSVGNHDAVAHPG
jgi:hypothetical protein